MVYLFLVCILFSACGSDISVITVEKNNDTAEVSEPSIEDSQSEPTLEPSSSPASEPESQPEASEPSEEYLGKDIFVEYGLRQISCLYCVGETNEITVDMKVYIHDPTEQDLFRSILDPGTCTSNFNYYQNSFALSYNYNPVTVYNNFNNYNLFPIQGVYSTTFNSDYMYNRLTYHSIMVEQFAFDDAFVSIEGFDYIEPYTMLYVDASYAFDPNVSRSGTYFSWGPAGVSDYFQILISAFSYDGSQVLGTSACASQDTGSLYFPGEYLQMYPPGSLLLIYMQRYSTSEQVINNSTISAELYWEVVGTGSLY
jgi:hypothetical protein